MSQSVREAIEKRELAFLAPYATFASQSRGRKRDMDDDPIRTCFQRDRDRVLHSKPFRRLKHKTQVFIDPKGDHYRTRLTHSLEVAQIGRTIGRALRLNEDLIEAIALAHDVGHTPFGHAGEYAMDEILGSLNGGSDGTLPSQFRHDEQSLRVVELAGLNLTYEVLDGIAGHSKGRADLDAGESPKLASLEAATVRWSDRIAYMNHDLDDAIRSGIVDRLPERFASLGSTNGERIASMVQNVVTASMDRPEVTASAEVIELMNELKEWLFENVYLEYPRRFPDIGKAKHVVKSLLAYYLEPGNLPAGYELPLGAIDYVAGMTDRFAIRKYQELFVPTRFTDLIEAVM